MNQVGSSKTNQEGAVVSLPFLHGLIGMLQFQHPNLIFPGLGKPERMICTHYYT